MPSHLGGWGGSLVPVHVTIKGPEYPDIWRSLQLRAELCCEPNPGAIGEWSSFSIGFRRVEWRSLSLEILIPLPGELTTWGGRKCEVCNYGVPWCWDFFLTFCPEILLRSLECSNIIYLIFFVVKISSCVDMYINTLNMLCWKWRKHNPEAHRPCVCDENALSSHVPGQSFQMVFLRSDNEWWSSGFMTAPSFQPPEEPAPHSQSPYVLKLSEERWALSWCR